MNNHTGTKTKLRTRILCKKCCIVFQNTSKVIRTNCPKCGRVIDGRNRSGQYLKYLKEHPEKAARRFAQMKIWEKIHKKERAAIGRKRLKMTVFNIISNNNPICANCGCDDIRLLEVNHINGGGNRELKSGKNTNVFMWAIYMGRRKTDDLNLLCRVCNALHYLESKYGKTRHRILYQ